MADDVQFTVAADATPPGGTLAATDETTAGPHTAGAHMGVAKLAVSADGDSTHIPATVADGLLVEVSNPSAGTGLTDTELRATPVPVSGTVSVTEPVSVDDNGGSLTVDGTVTADTELPPAAALSDNFVNPTAPAVGAFAMAYHVAGNNWDRVIVEDSAGLLVEQTEPIDVSDVIPGTAADRLGKAEDAPHSSGDVGVMALGVRNDSGTPLAPDGDYIPLMIGAAGGLVVEAGPGMSTSGLALEDSGNLELIQIELAAQSHAEDAPHVSGDLGVMALGVRNDAGTAFGANGDYVPLSIDAAGAARVTGTVATGGLTDAQLRATPVPVSGTVSVTEPVSVDDNGGSLTVDGTVTADTELPAAAALSDTNANPTAPAVGAFGMLWDTANAQWSRHELAQGMGAAVHAAAVVPVDFGGNPLLAGYAGDNDGNALTTAIKYFNGVNWDRARGDLTNGLDVDVTRQQPVTSAAATVTNDTSVTGAAESFAANAARRGLIITAPSANTQSCFIKFGASATTADYTAELEPGAYWEMGANVYSGAVSYIATSGTQTLHITEW